MSFEFNHTIAKIKNQNGEYEGMPALKGESVYDIAVRHGYAGDEDEFIKEIIEDGWVNACLDLEKNKVGKDEIYTKEQLAAGVHEPVGTLKITRRTDLGENWLLCNGAGFNPIEYPELNPLFVMDYDGHIDDMSSAFLSDDLPYALQNMVCANGYWVMFGYSTTETFVYSSTDFVNWTRVTIPYRIYSSTMEYVNGEFVIAGRGDSSATGKTLVIAHSANPAGEWILNTNAHTGSYEISDITGIAYGNGYYAVYGRYNRNNKQQPHMWCSTGLDSFWGETEVLGNQANTGRIRFINGKFVASYCANYAYTAIIYFDTPVGNITEVVVNTVASSQELFDVGYFGGKYFGVTKSTGSGNPNFFCYADSLDGPWTKIHENAFKYMYPSPFYYAGDELYFMVYDWSNLGTNPGLYVFHGTSPENLQQIKVTEAIANNNIGTVHCQICTENFIGYYYQYDSKRYFMANIRNRLPSITLDRAYAYIKAKN